jgi:hypothetical protein
MTKIKFMVKKGFGLEKDILMFYRMKIGIATELCDPIK